MLVEALKLYGTHEAPGEADNPVIIEWAKELGLADYKRDSTAWCGLFCAICAHRAGKSVPAKPLWALNWKQFGLGVTKPMLGDVLVFSRGEGFGHVGIYVGEDPSSFHVIGGNQSDQVSITRFDRGRLVAARRPLYSVQPPNVRPVHLAASGELSTNEA